VLERLLPADALRPRWSSGSALVYIGGFVVLFATASLLGVLGQDHGNAALVGFTALATAVALVLAVALQQADRPVAAGVLATLAVLFFASFVGTLEDLIGILDESDVTDDWQAGTLLLELVTIGVALVALRRFRAPLLVLPVALVFWIALVDFGAEEIMSIVAGVVLVATGHAVDRSDRKPYGFWLHFVGGLAFGVGVLALVDGNAGWILVGLLSIAFVAGAYTFGRSSYAVLGAIGILATTTHFIQDGLAFVGVFVPFQIGDPEGGIDPWQIAFYYVLAGLLILVLGLLGERFARLHGNSEA
jgi:hypothetical protein